MYLNKFNKNNQKSGYIPDFYYIDNKLIIIYTISRGVIWQSKEPYLKALNFIKIG